MQASLLKPTSNLMLQSSQNAVGAHLSNRYYRAKNYHADSSVAPSRKGHQLGAVRLEVTYVRVRRGSASLQSHTILVVEKGIGLRLKLAVWRLKSRFRLGDSGPGPKVRLKAFKV